MPEADRTMMNRMAIALARSQGATINPRTGRPSKHARKRGKWQLPPRRFLRSTEQVWPSGTAPEESDEGKQRQPGPSTPKRTTVQPSHQRGQSAPIKRTRPEDEPDTQQRRSAPAVRIEPRPIESSSQQPPSRPKLRLIRVRDEITRQLNFTELQAETYRQAERDTARARAQGLPWASRRRSSHTAIQPSQQSGREGSAEGNHTAHDGNPSNDHPMPDADGD
ncbi:MAG: Transcription elongation factor spt6 [Watsoniomyces obsoletus]|nr:MAG: Transcription elongation factor spt6 [Watsoniomyces obsoletus]